jgi:hypothetical protein
MNLISKTSILFEELLKKTKYFSKKIISIIPFAVVGGVSVSVNTDANAANVGTGVTDDDNTATAYDFNIATKDLTLTSDVSNAVYTIQTGAITDTATQSDIIISTQTGDTATLNVTVASAVLDAGDTAGVITIKDLDTAEGDMNVTFTGALTTDTTLIIQALEDEDSETMTINFDGATTITGAVEAENDASNATGALELKASAAITFTGGLDLSSNATSNAKLILDGTAAQTVAGVVDGEAANKGEINVTNAAGLVTFSGNIGGSAALNILTVGTTTNDSSAKFSGTVGATTINVQSGESATEDSSIAFDAAVTGALVLKPGAASSASVDFVDVNAITALTGAITTTSTDGDDTTINVYDDGGGAPAVQTFTGAIGTSSNPIGTLAIGQANGDAGSGNFDGAINVTNLTITADNGTSEASLGLFDDDVTATTITLDDDTLQATLELATAAEKTLAGTIDGAAADEGILKISAASKTVSGVIGGTFAIDQIDLDASATISASAAAKGITAADNVVGDFDGATITIGSDNIVLAGEGGEFMTSGTVAQSITGAINGSADGKGVLDNANTAATVTFATAIGATELQEVELDDSTTTIFQKAVKAKVADIDSGTVTFEENDNLFNALTTEASTVIIVGDGVGNGEELFTEGTGLADGNFAAGTKIHMPATLTDGQTITLVAQTTDAADAAILEDLEAAVVDTALTTYTGTVTEATNNNDLVFTAAVNSAADIGTNLGVTKNMGTSLQQVLNAAQADTTVRANLQDSLNSLNSLSTTDTTAFAKQAAPQQDLISGSTQAVRATTGAVQGVINNRMASLRSGDAYVAGMSAGDGVSANSMFMQAFGSITEQDSKIVGAGHQPGFDTDTAGVAIGIDSITDGGLVVGLSVSMSNTDLEGKGSGKSTNDIDTYTASLYMDKTGDAGYVEGSLTFGISENATSRVINSIGLDRTLKGEYDNQQVSVKIGGGLPYEAQNGAYVTPFASVTGTLIESDAYTETSTTDGDALRLRVDQDDINSIVGTIGLKAHMDTGTGVPMISLALNNEFGDLKVKSSNTFQGGGTAFDTETDVEEMSATLGLGYTYTNGNTDVTVGYEAEANNDDYLGHNGSVKLSSRF